jgi:hypothetical protein
VRAEADPGVFANAAAAQVHAVDPGLPVTNLRTVEDLMGTLLTQARPGVSGGSNGRQLCPRLARHAR